MGAHDLRLSCADSAFPRLSHEGSLTVVRDLGFEAVDVCSFSGYDHTPPEVVLADPSAAADFVRRRLDAATLRAADVFPIVGDSFEEFAPNHPDDSIRAESLAQFGAYVTFARALGSPGLTILPGVLFDGIDHRRSLEVAAEGLQRRAQIAGEAGLHLGFEPHFGSVAATPDRALELLGLAPGVGLTLDYSHFVYQGFPEHDVDPLLERTLHLHVRQAAPGDMQARAREGTIDFARVRDRLLELGYDGYFALEYQWEEGWLDFTRVDCITETAELRDLLLGVAPAV